MRDLENCRQEIDEIDAELVRLFERRMGVCRDVALEVVRSFTDKVREKAVGAAKQTLIHDHIDHCLAHALDDEPGAARAALAEFKDITKYL